MLNSAGKSDWGSAVPTRYDRIKHAMSRRNSGNKVEKTMHEFKHGDLHSGSKHGPLITDRRQAIAVALAQQRRANR